MTKRKAGIRIMPLRRAAQACCRACPLRKPGCDEDVWVICERRSRASQLESQEVKSRK